MAEAESVAEEIRSPDRPLGPPGRPFNRRSPFFSGMAVAGGMAVTAGVVWLLLTVGGTLVLIGLAFFVAVGLEPVVGWLAQHHVPRVLAVTAVVLFVLLALAGFFAALIPPLVDQTIHFVEEVPEFLRKLGDHSSYLGRLNDQYHIEDRARSLMTNPSLVNGLLGSGKAVLGALGNTIIVLVLSVYFLANFPRIRAATFRFVPHSRRPRAILIGDEIFAKVGWYVLGNLVISVIAAVASFIWFISLGVPYPVLLAILLALLDLIPIIGSTLAGIIISLVALTVSVPVFIATACFFVAYRVIEDYLLVPRIIGRVVRVPPIVTVVAVLLGGVLLGIIGALVAIPVAAAVLLILREVTFPRLDRA
ncbi:AI-2E family transporter [Amycolatopsis cynarae]|uniref:AI-2E family transporter n=1 Tax=Amycolatopsis cynarae TaxID=2995223 RepID=A0ABY7AZ71_9PSEU|nr:AI-2E family transporter [Amycolatopsis sp. HUAS 11-8]WAL65325.1 AI-2E family transporter [Amycolatopsis sp. HUAS 11-8]